MLLLSLLSSRFRRFDWLLLIAVVILSLLGLTTIYSVDLSRGETLDFFSTQSISFGLALLVLFVTASFHISFYESQAKLLYITALLLLIGVLFFGQTIRGTTGWFRFAGFSFQPAEFAKLALIIFLAWRIERQGRRFERWQFVAATGALSLFFIILILFQPDLGSAAVLGGIWFGLLLLTGTRKRYIVGLLTFIAIGFGLGWLFFFQAYQKERVLTFLDPARDLLKAGYNVNQSIIAVGSGKLLGLGLGFGSQSQLHFLPEAQTDFIVSVIGEELGFVGLAILFALYGIILWRLVRIGSRCRSDFTAYTVLGIALLFFIQLIVNTGAAFGLLPVTGVTLPFVSYGGSSLLINFSLIGIVESAARSISVSASA